MSMDIVDAQIHLFRTIGAEAGLAALESLGIQSAVIDEFWVRHEDGQEVFPGYWTSTGACRHDPAQARTISRSHPSRFAYLQRVDVSDERAASVIELASEDPVCRGIRIILRTPQEYLQFAEGAYGALFGWCGDAALPLFVYIENGECRALEPYLKAHARTSVVLDHIGMAHTPTKFDDVLDLGVYHNLCLKWCHGPMLAKDVAYPFPHAMQMLRMAIQKFDAERIMWASDFTTRQQSSTWAERLFYIRDSAQLTPLAKEHILSTTARRVLRWPGEKEFTLPAHRTAGPVVLTPPLAPHNPVH